MWKMNYDLINKYMYPNKDSYKLIKIVNLNIPIIEVGLNILVRKQVRIPFLHEIILKLISNNTNTTEQIEKVLGLDDEIINEVIGLMHYNNLINVTEHKVSLSPIGSDALKTLIKITKEREELNKVYIDGITGEIIELKNSPYLKSKDSSSLYLDPSVKINDNFLNNNFKKINEVYLNRLEEYNSNMYEDFHNELYKILEKKYETIVYKEEKLLIYKSCVSDDIIFECYSDNNIYGTTFSNQLKTNVGLNNLFSNTIKYSNFNYDNNKLDNKNVLELAIKERKKEEITEYYFKNRYLFENEYLDIIEAIKEIRPEKIILTSGFINIDTDFSIINLLIQYLNNYEIYICGCQGGLNFSFFKEQVLKKVSVKNKEKIKWINQNLIMEDTNIILYPECMITLKYIPNKFNDNEKKQIIQIIGEIIFDRKIIVEKVKLLGIDVESKNSSNLQHVIQKRKKYSKQR